MKIMENRGSSSVDYLALPRSQTFMPKRCLRRSPRPTRSKTSIGTFDYKDGAPSKETVAKTYDYLDLMHGVEAFVNAYQGASVAAIFKGCAGGWHPEQHGPHFFGATGRKVALPDGQCGHHLFLGQSGRHQGADRR